MAELPNGVVFRQLAKNHALTNTGAQCVITVRNPEKGQAVKADLEVGPNSASGWLRGLQAI